MKIIKYILFVSLLTSISILTACKQQQPETNNVLRIGTMSGPDAQVLATAKDVAAKKYNLDLKIIEFTDYALPNAALNDGSIDANIFQHQPYLDETIEAKHYSLAAIGKTFVFPMGIYSQKIKDLKDIEPESTVAIPNDPSNEARALLLLQKANLIKLQKGAQIYATDNDIIENPKHLKIKPLDAAQLPRVLPDVSLAVINSNYAIPAGLVPTHDALLLEDKNSPYVNIIVVRHADKDSPKSKTLVKVMHSPEVVAAAKKLFAGQAIPGWNDKEANGNS